MRGLVNEYVVSVLIMAFCSTSHMSLPKQRMVHFAQVTFSRVKEYQSSSMWVNSWCTIPMFFVHHFRWRASAYSASRLFVTGFYLSCKIPKGLIGRGLWIVDNFTLDSVWFMVRRDWATKIIYDTKRILLSPLNLIFMVSIHATCKAIRK